MMLLKVVLAAVAGLPLTTAAGETPVTASTYVVTDEPGRTTSSDEASGDKGDISTLRRRPPMTAAATVGGETLELLPDIVKPQAEDGWENMLGGRWPPDTPSAQLRGIASDHFASDDYIDVDDDNAVDYTEQQQQHVVPLQNMDSVQYFGEVFIGEPPQLMKILFDTGSSDIWVPGIGCTSCGLHSAFDNMASSTAVSMGRNFSNRYDSGSVEGSVIKDGVTIGNITVEGVEMGLVRHQKQHIRGFKADGIVGLAFPSISTTRNTSPSRHPTFVQLLQRQFGGVGDIFSVYLTPSPNQPGSVVVFGGYDLDLVRRPKKTASSSRQIDNRDTRQRSHKPPAGGYKTPRGKAPASLRGAVHHSGRVVGGSEAWAGGNSVPRTEGDRGRDTQSNVKPERGVLAGGMALLQGDDSDEQYGESREGRKGEEEDDDDNGDVENHEGGGAKKEHQDGDDEPVIFWTPVVEYRGAISYWTVELTGWRTEALVVGKDGHDSTAGEVRSQGSWEQGTKTSVVRVAGRDMCSTGCQAIVDTGSSLLVPPKSEFRAVMQEITGSRPDCEERHGMVSCSQCHSSSFPDIVISVAASKRSTEASPFQGKHGGQEGKTKIEHSQASVSGTDYTVGEVFSQEFRLKPSDYLSQSWAGCEILVGEGRATDIWTLGDAFIKTYMTIFDVANLRVGFVCADGGRCLGGAAPPGRITRRVCFPFVGASGADGDSSVGLSCVHMTDDIMAWALLSASLVLFVFVCVLLSHGIRSSSAGSNAKPIPLLSTSSSYPVLPKQQHHHQQQLRRLSESSNTLPEDHVDAGRGGGGVQLPERAGCGVVGGRGGRVVDCRPTIVRSSGYSVVSNSGACKTPERRREGQKKVILWWTWRPNALSFFLEKKCAGWGSMAADVQRSPPSTPSSTNLPSAKHAVARAGTPCRFWSNDESVLTGIGALNGDGMRSRGGTPRATAAIRKKNGSGSGGGDGSGDGGISGGSSSLGGGVARPRIGEL